MVHHQQLVVVNGQIIYTVGRTPGGKRGSTAAEWYRSGGAAAAARLHHLNYLNHGDKYTGKWRQKLLFRYIMFNPRNI